MNYDFTQGFVIFVGSNAWYIGQQISVSLPVFSLYEGLATYIKWMCSMHSITKRKYSCALRCRKLTYQTKENKAALIATRISLSCAKVEV